LICRTMKSVAASMSVFPGDALRTDG
jgi:hypothetical protein